MALTAEQLSIIDADMAAAYSAYYLAWQGGNLVAAKAQADRWNRDRTLAGIQALIAYPGYVIPTTYDNVVPSIAQLFGSVPAPVPAAPPASPLPPSAPAGPTPPAPVNPVVTPPIGPTKATIPKPRLTSGDPCVEDPASYCCFFPEDPACGGGGYPPGLGWPFPGGSGAGSTVIIQGVEESTVWSDIWGGLSTLWSIIVGTVDAALAAAIARIQAALTAIANALSAAFHALARLAGKILKLLQAILLDILHGMMRVLQEIARRLAQLYEKVLKPILVALGKIRKRLLDIYNRFIRPALIILQRIRAILGILKIFHVKWAAKLDAALADIQRRVIGPFLQILGYVNMLANWMNLIVTVGYLIQKPLWLNSLNAYKGSTINLQVNAMNPRIGSSELAGLQQQGAVSPAAQTHTDLRQQLTAGSSSLTTSIGSMNQTFHTTAQAGL